MNYQLPHVYIYIYYKVILIYGTKYAVLVRYIHTEDMQTYTLTHSAPPPSMCDSESGQHWFQKWLVDCSAPSIFETNAEILSTGCLGTNLSEILIEIPNI